MKGQSAVERPLASCARPWPTPTIRRGVQSLASRLTARRWPREDHQTLPPMARGHRRRAPVVFKDLPAAVTVWALRDGRLLAAALNNGNGAVWQAPPAR